MLQASFLPKVCRVCPKTFVPRATTQVVCGLRCAKKFATDKRKAEAKAERERTKARREKLKTLSDWTKEAQAAFNAWVRLRDADKPCISCGRFHLGAYDAGHYLTTGARPQIRFDERNVHRQCVPCNQHLHGNLVLYRVGLIERIGLAAVEALEADQSVKQYRVEDLRAIRDKYRGLVKAMKKGGA